MSEPRRRRVRRILLVVAVAWAAALGVSAQAQAAFPGLNGKIAFSDFTRSPWPIVTVNPDGGQRTNVSNDTTPGQGDAQAAWSPDGRLIAFQRQAGSGPSTTIQVWVMNADGSSQHNVSNNAFRDFSPSWSPDGSQIAFNRQIGTGSQIWVMNADGSNQHDISNNSFVDARPKWAPDGSAMLFVRQPAATGQGGQIWAMNPDGSNQHALTTNDTSTLRVGSPDWSPDSRQIVYTSNISSSRGEIWVMNADGSNQHKISLTDGDYNYGPTWSPDGTLIAYTRDFSDSSPSQIWAMNPDGSNNHAVTTANSDFRPDWQPLANVASTAQIAPCSQNGQITVTVGDASGFHSPPKAVHFQIDGGPEQTAPTSGSTATITVPQGRHSLNFWGENQAGDQETTLHTVDVLVDATRPRVRITADQHHGTFRRGQFASVTIRASDPLSGLVRNPSRRHLRVSTARLGTHTVRATATDSCGNSTTARLRYRVVRAAVVHRRHRAARPRFTG